MQHAYDAAFMEYTERTSRHSAQLIVRVLREVLSPQSVLDVGCARGTWLNAWREAGAEDAFGVDGEYLDAATLAIAPERFRAADLSRPLDLGRQFDLVQSLEVAEHVPAAAAPQFVENLVTHSRGVVLFSAAPPGQGGEFHVNEQPYDYWRALFARHGFAAHDYVRPRIAGDTSVSFWYRFNILLYVRDGVELPAAVRSTRIADGVPVTDLLSALFRLRKLAIRGLPYAWQQGLARFKARVLRTGRF